MIVGRLVFKDEDGGGGFVVGRGMCPGNMSGEGFDIVHILIEWFHRKNLFKLCHCYGFDNRLLVGQLGVGCLNRVARTEEEWRHMIDNQYSTIELS